MGRQAVKRYAPDLFLPPESRLLELPARTRLFPRMIGWVYQLLLWSIVILGVVHTVHQRVLPPEGEAGSARAAVHRGLDYLSSLLSQ